MSRGRCRSWSSPSTPELKRKAAAALAAGALEAISKDDLDLDDPAGPPRPRSGTGPGCSATRRSSATRGPGSGRRRCRSARARASVIGMCGSTGGPQSWPGCSGPPRRLPDPDPRGPAHLRGLHRRARHWLDQSVPLPSASPRTGRRSPGAWIAPDGAHLKLWPPGGCASTHAPWSGTTAPPVTCSSRASPRPSAGRRRRRPVRMATTARPGRGDPAAGGLVIAQDEASSAIFGCRKQRPTSAPTGCRRQASPLR